MSSCLSEPRGQIIFEFIVSILIVVILIGCMVSFIIIKDYGFAFQVGNIAHLYLSSAIISLFFRARSLQLITHEKLKKFKFCIDVFSFLQYLSLVIFILIIIYCLVEIAAPIDFWKDFNQTILQYKYSGNASFFLIFLPIHIYYISITLKLRKLMASNNQSTQNDHQLNATLLVQQQQQEQDYSDDLQVVMKTTSILSEDIPNEIKFDKTCSICQDDIDDQKIIKFDCEHIFHSQCIRQWLKTKKNTCPNCRVSIVATRNQSDFTTFVQQSIQIEDQFELNQPMP